MQFLYPKMWSPNRCAKPEWTAQGSSPFQQFVKDIDNKRSKLFPDRRKVPGRKTKFIVAIVYLVHMYTFMKLMQAKKIYGLKEQQRRQNQRKMAPFFQSFEDIHYTTIKHRMDLIMIEIFKVKGGESHLEKFNRFSKAGMWSQTFEFQTWAGAGTSRYNAPFIDNMFNAYMPGFNIQNI